MAVPRLNQTKRKLADGGTAIGVMLKVPSPRLVEMIGYMGFDYVVLDAESVPIDRNLSEHLARAAEIAELTPIIRTLDHSAALATSYLDSGFQGVMMPNVSSVRDAQRLVDACKFAPLGRRGIGAARAARYGMAPLKEFVARANEEIMAIALLEDVQVLDELDGIVSTPGVDVFALGPSDLSNSMGHAGDPDHPEVRDALRRITDAIEHRSGIVNPIASSAAGARTIAAGGVRMLTLNYTSFAEAALLDIRSAVMAQLEGRT